MLPNLNAGLQYLNSEIKMAWILAWCYSNPNAATFPNTVVSLILSPKFFTQIVFVVLILQCKSDWTHMIFRKSWASIAMSWVEIYRAKSMSNCRGAYIYFVPVQHSSPRLVEETCLLIEMYYSTNNQWNIGRSGFYYFSNFLCKSPCNTIFQTSYFTI